jgi:hypothetical protein
LEVYKQPCVTSTATPACELSDVDASQKYIDYGYGSMCEQSDRSKISGCHPYKILPGEAVDFTGNKDER